MTLCTAVFKNKILCLNHNSPNIVSKMTWSYELDNNEINKVM